MSKTKQQPRIDQSKIITPRDARRLRQYVARTPTTEQRRMKQHVERKQRR